MYAAPVTWLVVIDPLAPYILSSLIPPPIGEAARDGIATAYAVRTFSFAFDLDQQSMVSRALV